MPKIDMPQEYFNAWTYYIYEDRIDELKEIYRKFKRNESVESYSADIEKQNIDYIYADKPVIKPVIVEITESKIQRDTSILERALAYAGHRCELDCSNQLFIRKNGDCLYTEGHHLIPLKYQSEFEYSLDVEANIVSLCPMCHRQLHYGLENRDKLIMLYEKRIKRLEKCKISVSLEKLLSMYV